MERAVVVSGINVLCGENAAIRYHLNSPDAFNNATQASNIISSYVYM